MIEVADLPAIGAALAGRVRLVVDNTFATPLLQQPLATGADIVLHAVTKFIAGHSDALLGALVVRESDTATYTALEAVRRSHGATPGTMEAYLALRGLRTLPLRLTQAQTNAGVLAERLAAHPAVQRVRYPGLPEDPGHERAARTMSGFGSLISVDLADAATADAFVAATRLWVFATSLGGVESRTSGRTWNRRWTPCPEIVREQRRGTRALRSRTVPGRDWRATAGLWMAGSGGQIPVRVGCASPPGPVA
jgi:cystathionine gamma-synthase